MNDAHVYEMQVQMWKPNTWGVTRTLHTCRTVPSGHARRVLYDLLGMSEPKQRCRRRHLPHSVVGAVICPRAWILTEAHDNHYGPEGMTQDQTSGVVQGAFTP